MREIQPRDGSRIVDEERVAQLAARATRCACPGPVHLVQRIDVRYLDLDHDGVVDAVETIESICEDAGRPPGRPLATVRTLQAEIDDAGTPHRVLGYTSCA